MGEAATNTGNIVGKIDQHVGGNKTPTGYKYQYVNTDKNKKLGIITKDNVNHILYNLLWDIVSHQVDNETARGEWKEVQWLLKRYPKDENRSDDTGVSNETINKYVKKAKDIVGNMKEPVEEEAIYVDNGKITKRSSETAKKLNEEADEIPDISVKYPNGEKVKSEIDLVAAIQYMYGISAKQARENIKDNKYSEEDLQKAINYWVEKTDGDPNWNELNEELTEEGSDSRYQTIKKMILGGNSAEGLRDYIDHCVDKGKITDDQKDKLLKMLASREELGLPDMDEDSTVGNYSIKKVTDNGVTKYAVYDKAGNLRATYPDEQTAKDAVQGKKIFEEVTSIDKYNPFDDMVKSDEKEWRVGLYTDGEGSFYEAPKSGETPWIKKNGLKYRYNFKTNEIEVADNSEDVFYTSSLMLANWLDNPEYWFDKAYKEMQDEDEAFIEDYFKKHPDADKRNISVADLKEEKNEDSSKDLLNKGKTFKYQMLSRLQSDCKYFLGNGNRNVKHLWGKDVDEHINIMKDLYNSFSDEDKPEWIDLKTIEEYHKDMSEDKIKEFADGMSESNELFEKIKGLKMNEDESGKKFSSVKELEEYLSNKNSVIIYFDNGEYSIIDEERSNDNAESE